jgi:hypothetical protein
MRRNQTNPIDPQNQCINFLAQVISRTGAALRRGRRGAIFRVAQKRSAGRPKPGPAFAGLEATTDKGPEAS